MYLSTRSKGDPVPSSRALLEGLSPDGGLFVPERFPRLDPSIGAGRSIPYGELSAGILASWFPELEREDLVWAARKAAALFPSEPAPLVAAGDLRLLELFHGPTLAFKDFALSVLGDLLSLARRDQGEVRELLILVATSGDTGKAALQGFADRPGIKVLVFFPEHGVSGVQRLQMLTHGAANGGVIGIEGNFDDAQRGVKSLFSDPSLSARLGREGLRLGSANSINVGRLVPQVAYYVHAWRALCGRGELEPGESFDVVVPTGNFGDALAAWYAKAMGLPLGRIVVATNANKVLDDFFRSGICDRRRPFFPTTSPSMDILAASNLERLIFEAVGRDPDRCASLMGDFAREGHFQLSGEERAFLADFESGSATDEESSEAIRATFEATGYLLDPHAACAVAVHRKLGGRARPVVIVATASPFKFCGAVSRAIGLPRRSLEGNGGDEADLALVAALAEKAGLQVPQAVSALGTLPRRSHEVVDPAGMEGALWRALERMAP